MPLNDDMAADALTTDAYEIMSAAFRYWEQIDSYTRLFSSGSIPADELNRGVTNARRMLRLSVQATLDESSQR